MRQNRLVAVGDGVTEGVGDPGRGALRGWVHYLAADPRLFLVANLGRAGAVVADVRRHQLDRALALRPDVVTCVIGVNDVLGRGFDPAAFERGHDHVAGALPGVADFTRGFEAGSRGRRAARRGAARRPGSPPGDLGRPAPAVAWPTRDLIRQAELISPT
ncbi:MAG: GDSL-type esterase/lipase family protein [Umezawaea sp.]